LIGKFKFEFCELMFGVGCWIISLFRTTVKSVTKEVINEESSDINLVNGFPLVWLSGYGILLESATEALEGLGERLGVLRRLLNSGL